MVEVEAGVAGVSELRRDGIPEALWEGATEEPDEQIELLDFLGPEGATSSAVTSRDNCSSSGTA